MRIYALAGSRKISIFIVGCDALIAPFEMGINY